MQHNRPLHTESRPACFTDKQVSACSIQVYHGSMGINAWKTFVLTVEHSYIVRKLEIYGWAYPPCHENPMLPIVAANRSACFSFSAANYSWNLHKKAGLHHTESCRQFQSCIIRLLSARDLVVSPAPPWSPGFLGRMSPTRDTHHAEWIYASLCIQAALEPPLTLN